MFCIPARLLSQEVYKAGLFPQINLIAPLDSNWELNFLLKPRHILFQGSPGEAGYHPEYERTDFETIILRRMDKHHAGGAGYMVRYKDGMFYHRTSQQLSSTFSRESLRFGQRTILDQTFGRGKLPVFRVRFRLFTEIPAQGQGIDPGEFYFKLHNEELVLWEGPQADLEVRGLAMPGLRISKNTRTELGLDYRLSNLLEGSREHQFWLCWVVAVSI